MLKSEALTVADKIFQAIFGTSNPYDLEQLSKKFAFDIELPVEVKDYTSGETTYTVAPNAQQFMTNDNSNAHEDWMLPRQDVKNLKEVLEIWRTINFMVTERVYNSKNVHASDPIYGSENVYGSTNCNNVKNAIFCDGCHASEYIIACRRSGTSNFCLRVDDSADCSNSYNVTCSNTISNSYFIQDASHLHECIFCSHISDHEYCIANMQFAKEEYFYLKKRITEWILANGSD